MYPQTCCVFHCSHSGITLIFDTGCYTAYPTASYRCWLIHKKMFPLIELLTIKLHTMCLSPYLSVLEHRLPNGSGLLYTCRVIVRNVALLGVQRCSALKYVVCRKASLLYGRKCGIVCIYSANWAPYFIPSCTRKQENVALFSYWC